PPRSTDCTRTTPPRSRPPRCTSVSTTRIRRPANGWRPCRWPLPNPRGDTNDLSPAPQLQAAPGPTDDRAGDPQPLERSPGLALRRGVHREDLQLQELAGDDGDRKS